MTHGRRIPPPDEADVLLFGASVRALAFSCLRAGLRPVAVDLFADSDLRARCPTLRASSDRWPRSLLEIARHLPRRPVLYTGGLESHPEIVAGLSSDRELWGNTPDTLRLVRDPIALCRLALAAGFDCPRCLRAASVPSTGDWIEKPARGSGGVGIRRARAGDPVEAGSWLQERVEGSRASAVAVADADGARLLGLSRQLVGESWLHAPTWTWCGNIAPLSLSESTYERLEASTSALAVALGLRGLFGLDLILDARGEPHLIEINPRYTGSVEVIERLHGLRAIDAHRRAFRPPDGDVASARAEISPRLPELAAVGKAVLFAAADLVIARPLEAPAGVRLADVPAPGTKIRAGRPIVSLLCDSDDVESCEHVLQRAASTLRFEPTSR